MQPPSQIGQCLELLHCQLALGNLAGFQKQFLADRIVCDRGQLHFEKCEQTYKFVVGQLNFQKNHLSMDTSIRRESKIP